MDIPQGDKNYNNRFWKLNKAIYGLIQAGRMWSFKINDTLLELGFNRCKSEPCVYIKKDRNNNIICILAIYVYDILIAGKNKEINKIRERIKNKFELFNISSVLALYFLLFLDSTFYCFGTLLSSVLGLYGFWLLLWTFIIFRHC